MKKLFILLISLLLASVGCESEIGIENSSYNTISPPRNLDIPMEGTWVLNEVIDLSTNLTTLAPHAVGDKLYITSDLVGINDMFTISPEFSTKFVEKNAYLTSRHSNPPDSTIFEDENLNVMMVRDQDIFNIDFIRLGEDELCFIYENRYYHFLREEKLVSNEVINDYKSTQQENTVNPAVVTNSEDISTLIGLRTERRDENGNIYFEYNTYLVSDFWAYRTPRVHMTSDIISGTEEGQLRKIDYNIVNTDPNLGTIEAEFIISQLGDDTSGKQIVFEDFYNRGITYTYENTISFTKNDLSEMFITDGQTGPSQSRSYEIYSFESLEREEPLTVAQIGGEEEQKSFADQVLNQLNYIDPEGSINPEDITIDYTNIGIERGNAGWQFMTSKDWLVGGELVPTRFSVDIVPLLPIVQSNSLQIPWSRVTNKNYNAEDAFTTNNMENILIKTDDEILYYRLHGDHIATSPEFSIQIPDNSTIVMMGHFYGTTAEKINNEFLSQPLLQPQVINLNYD